MIESYVDYINYLEEDKKALKIKRSKPRFLRDRIWRYQRLLRKVEYYHNCRGGILSKIYYQILRYQERKLAERLGYSIPINVFGPGLSIAHQGTIVVNAQAKVGSGCRLHVCVNIGGRNDEAPEIGNNVYIGPGVKIFGSINISDNIAIGANAVVNKSFNEPGITIGGIPAKKISNTGSSKHLSH